jgi:hypothetical protein
MLVIICCCNTRWLSSLDFLHACMNAAAAAAAAAAVAASVI